MQKMARGYASFKELVWDPLDCLDHSELENAFMHVWLVWHNRSGFIQEGRIQDPTKLANKAVAYIMEYQDCCRKKHGERLNLLVDHHQRWGHYKVSFDGTVFTCQKWSGVGRL